MVCFGIHLLVTPKKPELGRNQGSVLNGITSADSNYDDWLIASDEDAAVYVVAKLGGKAEEGECLDCNTFRLGLFQLDHIGDRQLWLFIVAEAS